MTNSSRWSRIGDTRAVIALSLALSCALAHAEIYRWTDDSGTVQYTQTPPPVGTPFRLVDEAEPPPEPEQRRGVDAFLEQREQQREAEAKRERAAERAARQRAAKCEQARKTVSRLSSRPPNRIGVRQPDGSYKRMDPEVHDKQLSHARATVAEACP